MPANPGLQIIRLFNTGVALFLLLESYKTLSAATVSLLSRLDIPLVIIFSIVTGKKKSIHQVFFSFLVIGMVAFFTWKANLINETTIGFAYGIGSVFLLSISYLILKKSVETENPFMLASIASIGGLLVGITIMAIRHKQFIIDWEDSWIFIAISVITIVLFYIGSILYKMYTVEKARVPYVLIPICTMLFEMINEHRWFGINQVMVILLLTACTLIICFDKLPFKTFKTGKQFLLGYFRKGGKLNQDNYINIP